MSIVFEKGIPVPRGGRPIGSKFDPMEVDDSFFVAGGVSRNVVSQMGNHGRTTGRKYACRSVTENGVTGVRVWRVK